MYVCICPYEYYTATILNDKRENIKNSLLQIIQLDRAIIEKEGAIIVARMLKSRDMY